MSDSQAADIHSRGWTGKAGSEDTQLFASIIRAPTRGHWLMKAAGHWTGAAPAPVARFLGRVGGVGVGLFAVRVFVIAGF